MDKHEDKYKTSNLSLAAAISLHHQILEVDIADPRRALFIFNNKKSLSKLIERYWKGNLLVNPQDYFDALKALKTRIYSETESHD